MPPSQRSILSPSQYFVLEPDGLKLITPSRPGDGVTLFDDAQLRAAYPGIAEDAIAFRDSAPFSEVIIDQVQEDIVRLRGTYGGNGGESKLLHGRSLEHQKKDFGTQITLIGAPSSEPVTAHDESGRPLTNEELQERERERGPTEWKYWYSRSRNVWFVAPVMAQSENLKSAEDAEA